MKNIKAIIWDMDGVKYMLDESATAAFHAARIKTATHYMPHLEAQAIEEISLHSFKTYHSSYDFLFREHGHDMRDVSSVFWSYMEPDWITAASSDYKHILSQTTVQHAILTQGNSDWAQRLLTKLEILDLFDARHITTLEEMGPHRKNDSVEPFLIALNKLNCAPENAIMVEDTQVNLKHAKELGMTTVLVHPREDFVQENYTDYVFATPVDFLNAFTSAQANMNAH